MAVDGNAARFNCFQQEDPDANCQEVIDNCWITPVRHGALPLVTMEE